MAWGEMPVLKEHYELQIVELSFGGMKRDNLPENPPANSGNPPITADSLDNAILLQIQSKPTITYDELAEMTHKHRDTIRVHIKALKERGVIERIGSAKDGRWQVNVAMEGNEDI